MRRLTYLSPLILVMVLGGYFLLGLQRDPNVIPSVLIDQDVPDFQLGPVMGQDSGFKRADLVGQVSLVNVFGSWCLACLTEHPFLMRLKQEGAIPIYGINWREPDTESGPKWLKRYGNPYTLIGHDPRSEAAIAFGVTGAPETFIVDAKGVIRFKFSGPITENVWDQSLFPIIKTLRTESRIDGMTGRKNAKQEG